MGTLIPLFRLPLPIVLAATLAHAGGAAAQGLELPAIAANDNRVPAGRDEGAVRAVDLEIRPGRWFAEGSDGPSEVVLAFAERGAAAQVPGPLLRVREGTRLRVSLTNGADRELVVRGLAERPAAAHDTLRLAPGEARTVEFAAGPPGTYFYWATSMDSLLENIPPEESQLHGALIVDPADAPEPLDRVFVMGLWFAPADSSAAPPVPGRETMTINGLSWPHTERLAYALGDTVRWRVLNPTTAHHPMHLHGFYYDVTSSGTWAADTVYAAADRRVVVTELMDPFSTRAMEFVPTTPGNWLFHCHFAFHVSHFLSFVPVPEHDDPGAPGLVDGTAHGMRGLILGFTVDGGNGRDPEPPPPRRTIRLHALEGKGAYVGPSYAFAIQAAGEPKPVFDSLPPMGPTLVLRRGEPVRIEIVNHLRVPTAVHWHGIELERSFPDGVPGWSGRGANLAPAALPGGTFVAEFTPPRAGTFIYHSHSNELLQIGAGLYGALIVEDPARPYDPAAEPIVMVGGNGWVEFEKGRINGALEPAPLDLAVGRTYRLRLININPDFLAVFRLQRGEELLAWRPVAKDGADLPAGQATTRPATATLGPGETLDVELTSDAAADLALSVSPRRRQWTTVLPIRVR